MESHPPERRYEHTEATRLMCAGVHLNAAFRRRVIGELVGNAQRPVAPAFGADVLPVLAHALRARREEIRTALLLLAVWVFFLVSDAVMFWDTANDLLDGGSDLSVGDAILFLIVPKSGLPNTLDSFGPGGLLSLLPGGWAIPYAVVAVLLWLGRTVSGRGAPAVERWSTSLPAAPDWLRSRGGRLITFYAWFLAVIYWYSALKVIADNPYPVIFPLLTAVVIWRHQWIRKRTLRGELARGIFAATEPPPLPVRYRRIGECVRREQDASLTLYDANRPFVGAGTSRQPWSVVLELKPADGSRSRAQSGPPTAHEIISMIVPRLSALRTSAATTSKDRLRELEMEEFVYLPSGVGRDEPLYLAGTEKTPGIYQARQVERHLTEAAGEGGEARRHFLRVRVGAWDEQVVVTLLVRVHTQGGMLVLEVLPHVLGPIVKEFREVDTIVSRAPEGPLRDALRALVESPRATVAVGVAALRHNTAERAAPDAPMVSLRELASTDELSLLQKMDVDRYIKTLQDRIGEGVRDALAARGYRTDRLEQNITNINNNGVYIGAMSGGAMATGSHGTATHTERKTT